METVKAKAPIKRQETYTPKHFEEFDTLLIFSPFCIASFMCSFSCKPNEVNVRRNT